jgi:hypothetical protein
VPPPGWIRDVRHRIGRTIGRRVSLREFGSLIALKEKRAAWTHAAVSRWETGRQLPGPRTQAAIAALAEMPAHELEELLKQQTITRPLSEPSDLVRESRPDLFSQDEVRWLYRFLWRLAEAGATRKQLKVAELWVERAIRQATAIGPEPGEAPHNPRLEAVARALGAVLLDLASAREDDPVRADRTDS